ncbi:Alpha/Beta hydrolase protein [Jackrogersella minutella]|nr:Alpha/Beta hydrolase protein [Jackrogersella minutella]
MMLPRPSLSFTLPSVHDNTKLDCRVYHPTCLNGPLGPSDTSWHQHAAVVAHPYAPLGGSYEDPVVHLVASTLLQLGFIVATFNFRGASSSHGRTSWTSKPERADYISVTGFLVYYVHYLRSPQHPSTDTNHNAPPPTLLLAGYSYGAMVTLQLPPLGSFLSDFSSPPTHTPLADIRLRAQHLAEQQIMMSVTPSSPRKSLGMRVGGDEDTIRQKPREKLRLPSPDREERIRKGVREILSRHKLIHRKHRHHHHHHHHPAGQLQTGETTEHEEICLESVGNLIQFRCAFLLVSPPLGIVTNLATMSFSNPLSSWSKSRKEGSSLSARNNEGNAKREEIEAEMKLVRNPTLVIYGDSDGFLTLKKMHDWTSQLGKTEGSQFRHVEISGAGHFWAEDGVVYELRESISSFAARLVGNP